MNWNDMICCTYKDAAWFALGIVCSWVAVWNWARLDKE